jgi:hypothetical protein
MIRESVRLIKTLTQAEQTISRMASRFMLKREISAGQSEIERTSNRCFYTALFHHCNVIFSRLSYSWTLSKLINWRARYGHFYYLFRITSCRTVWQHAEFHSLFIFNSCHFLFCINLTSYYVKWPFLASTGWLRITLLVFFTFLVVKIGKRIKKS